MFKNKLLPPAFSLARYIININNRVYDGLLAFVGKLSFVQKLYLFAFILLCFNKSLAIVAAITVVGLLAEFWPLFTRVWHSLAGKAVLLLFYAVIANFALAGAASVVNEVVGVSSSHFSYTHNFAILLYLPAWTLAISIIALLVLQVFVPFYLFTLLLLKPFGIDGFNLTNLQHYQKWTMFFRLVLSSILLYHLALLSDVDSVIEENLDNPKLLSIQSPAAEQSELKKVIQISVDELEQAKKDQEITNSKKPKENSDNSTLNTLEQEITTSVNKSKQLRALYAQKTREFIAHFAYQLEADGKSRCAISNNAHIVELNDYEILEISPDMSKPYGYHFEVKVCQSPAFPL
ncbi:Conserved hypothetical protein [Shewanella piezotolerans WP3]|uniref:Uncharacterized protein n=1 Tax=Shewanella piezotolerans (strain WP3 / JCM 13877) TaxID=225849 RepID=B8CP24_SHEPW|nr:hypothetical protein [Shewanella piezotolerans]ACJ29268.1 Conserved hypothetical protein [Shewanella piezotolerans WP3]